MSEKDIREYDLSEIAIIREVYDSENSHEAFGEELEHALEAGCQIIIVEPTRLGDETARWISVGNCLHKTAVLSGLGAIGSAVTWPDLPFMYSPLCAMSLFCTGLYTVSWQFDPCVQYQVNNDSRCLAKLPISQTLTSASPIILVRKNDATRKLLHNCVTLTAVMICVWKLYDTYSK